MKNLVFILLLVFCVTCTKSDLFKQTSRRFECNIKMYTSSKNGIPIDTFYIENPTIDFLNRCKIPIIHNDTVYTTTCKLIINDILP